MLGTQFTRFGHSGMILRANSNIPLSREVILEKAPSVFATEKHSSRSEKYSYIPTLELFDAMRAEGFFPMEVRQGGTKDLEKRSFTKHLLRFRQCSATPVVGDTFPEIVLINSHDGTSSYHLYAGWFRLVCLNGMVVSEREGPSVKIPHRGNVDDVIEASFTVVKEFEAQGAAIEQMTQIALTEPEQRAFAQSAALLRFNEEHAVSPHDVLRLRRYEDRGNDLWKTFNRTQENLLNGNVRTRSHDHQGIPRTRYARAVNNLADNVRLNQALWSLAEEMKRLKTQ